MPSCHLLTSYLQNSSETPGETCELKRDGPSPLPPSSALPPRKGSTAHPSVGRKLKGRDATAQPPVYFHGRARESDDDSLSGDDDSRQIDRSRRLSKRRGGEGGGG
eukprot:CAMPEP_0181334210 /NCGR_PEP_ID=MMETSP1101-20121128/26121_1 /TAXON_ID=46948 /ORGANISM="Rhodomonas abbreviata, Strain Caron Lab Isolate" /LENGTH=105 /DNA_ID=CAMNT_0023444137 /DNA_START=357 /DNA_END=671 /DNA_ORIENTATION=+